MAKRPAVDVPIGESDILSTCLPAEAHLDELAAGRSEMARSISR